MTGHGDASQRPEDLRAVDADNPWPGLAAFREGDQAFFRGRRSETEALHHMVRLERLTLVFGKSGLGKTSLLLAGLFPRLRAENIFPVYLRLDYSQGDLDLQAQIKKAIRDQAADWAVEAPEAMGSESLWEYFHRKDAFFWYEHDRPEVPLLVFDQFEEMFTLGRESSDAEALVDALGELVEGHPPADVKARLDANPEEAREFSFGRHGYKVLLSLREDFLPELEKLRDRIRSIVQNRLRLEPMTGEAAFEVVTGPSELITGEVAERVIRSVAAAESEETPFEELVVEPALLSVVCRELNNLRLQREEPRIIADDLEKDQARILSRFYERNLRDVAPAMRTFVEEDLVLASGYRNMVAYDNALDVEGVTEKDVARLIDRRLLRIEQRRGISWLELTHDLLTGVVVASRDARRRREAEERAEAARRQEQERAEAARRDAEERERKTLEQLRKTRLTAAILVFLLTVAALAVAWALRERTAAEEERNVAEQERERAVTQTEIATKATTEAERQEGIAAEEARKAIEAKEDADDQKKIAEANAETAREAKERAEQSAREADQARLEALELRKIAVARQLAARAEATLGRPGLTLELGTLLAVESLERFPTVEGDLAIRLGLARLPFQEEHTRLPIVEPSRARFSPDGRYVLSPRGPEILILDAASGERKANITLGSRRVERLTFSRDGRSLAVATSGRISVWRAWNSSTPERIAAIDLGDGDSSSPRLDSLALSADGVHLATARGQTVTIWDVSSADPVATVEHQTPPEVGFGVVPGRAFSPAGLAFSPDGRYLASANGSKSHSNLTSSVKIWEGWQARGEAREVVVLSHEGSVRHVAYSPDSLHLVTDGEAGVQVWDSGTYHRLSRLRPGASDYSPVISPDGERLAIIEGGTGVDRGNNAHGRYAVHVWEDWRTASPREALRMIHRPGWVPYDVSFSKDGSRLITLSESLRGPGIRVSAWETRGYREVARVVDPEGSFSGVALGPDGKYLATTSYRSSTGRIWSLPSGNQVGEPIPQTRGVAVSPDGEILATATGECVKLWRAWRSVNPKEIDCLEPTEGGKAWRVAFSADGAYIAASTTDPRTAQVWRLENREQILFKAVSLLAIGPKGRFLALGRAQLLALKFVEIWDVELREKTRVLRIPERSGIPRFAFSQDGSLLAATGREEVILWSVHGGDRVGTLRHESNTHAVVFSSDGKYLATASGVRSGPHTAHIWDYAADRRVAGVRQAGEINHVAFSQDGKYLATANRDGTASVWLWRSNDLIDEACRRLTRNFSKGEWSRYLGEDEAYEETCQGLPIPKY